MPENIFNPSKLEQAVAAQVRWQAPSAVVAASGLVALCAHIAIPLGFTPVPVSMQTFAVLLIGLIFSPGAAFAALALYLLEGAIGLPVFSPYGPGGLAQLFGPTGGYLISYPLAAILASFLFRRTRQGVLGGVVAASLASLLTLALGATWLGTLTHANFSSLLVQSVVPFLPGDAVKVVAAACCACVFNSFRKPFSS